MTVLEQGRFYGETDSIIRWEGITLTNTEYTHAKVDWHYHENAYFTFLLQGKVIEGNKKQIYHCTPGALIFHYWQDAHYNIKPRGYTRGFHAEITKNWFDRYELKTIEGSINIGNPDIKLLFHRLYKESRINDAYSGFSSEQLLLSIFYTLSQTAITTLPWIEKLKEILHYADPKTLTLSSLAKDLDLHPVHLCRSFTKYFHCTLGDYLRKLQIEKALSLLHNKNYTLTEIANECGFSDQSHFLRNFKRFNGVSPSCYRRLIK